MLPNIASSYISAHAEAASDYFFPTLLLDSLKGEKFLEQPNLTPKLSREGRRNKGQN